MTMTYLITGATGFIGRSLVDMLLADGQVLHYLGRRRDPSMDSRVAFHLWETPGVLPPLETVPHFDALIHLAGEPIAQRWTESAKNSIRVSRVIGTGRLVESLGRLRQRPQVLVSASAIGYYGNRGDEILTETSGPGTGFLADVCSEWERAADRAEEYGLRVVKIRTGIVLGENGGALRQMLPAFRYGLGGRFGNGRQWMSWIHRDDLLRMIRWAAETAGIHGVLNGTAPTPVENAEFTKELACVLRRPAVWRVPQFVLRAALGEMAGFLFDSTRALPAAAERQGFSFEYRTLSHALAFLSRPHSQR